jgi:hypothetical protein
MKLGDDKKQPALVSVRIIPWEGSIEQWGLECTYDDGIVTRELWGGLRDSLHALAQRQRDVTRTG